MCIRDSSIAWHARINYEIWLELKEYAKVNLHPECFNEDGGLIDEPLSSVHFIADEDIDENDDDEVSTV